MPAAKPEHVVDAEEQGYTPYLDEESGQWVVGDDIGELDGEAPVPEADWDEEKHPRDAGKFTSGGGSGGEDKPADKPTSSSRTESRKARREAVDQTWTHVLALSEPLEDAHKDRAKVSLVPREGLADPEVRKQRLAAAKQHAAAILGALDVSKVLGALSYTGAPQPKIDQLSGQLAQAADKLRKRTKDWLAKIEAQHDAEARLATLPNEPEPDESATDKEYDQWEDGEYKRQRAESKALRVADAVEDASTYLGGSVESYVVRLEKVQDAASNASDAIDQEEYEDEEDRR